MTTHERMIACLDRLCVNCWCGQSTADETAESGPARGGHRRADQPADAIRNVTAILGGRTLTTAAIVATQNQRGRTIGPMHPAALADLAAPALPGARCRGRADLFDTAAGNGASRAEIGRARDAALRLCRPCSVLTLCRRWFEALPAAERLERRGRRPAPHHPAHRPHTLVR